MVKIGRSEKRKLSQKINCTKIGGIYKFCGNKRDMQYASSLHMGVFRELRGMDAHAHIHLEASQVATSETVRGLMD